MINIIACALLSIIPWHTGSKDPDAAARAGFAFIREHHPAYISKEYGGLIYKSCGLYYVSIPQAGAENTVTVRFNPKNGEVVGFYHTHPHRESARYLSPEDKAIGKKFKIDVYMLGPWDNIQVYNGKTDRIRDL